jgi:hypothetical protein
MRIFDEHTRPIYGLSPTTGAERTLRVERTAAGMRLHFCDPESYDDLDQIEVSQELLLAALIDCPAERTAIKSDGAAGEARKVLDIEIRRNEVLLWVRTETGRSWDIAVGFDDFQDALERAADAA